MPRQTNHSAILPASLTQTHMICLFQLPRTQNALTRAGGRGKAAAAAAPRRVVVDMREFMSCLPAALHQRGFELVPVTLEVRPQGGCDLRVL